MSARARSHSVIGVLLAGGALLFGGVGCGRNGVDGASAHARADEFVHAPHGLPPPPLPIAMEHPPEDKPTSPWQPGRAAFRLPVDGACPAESELFDGVCVHASVFATTSREAVANLVRDYRRGAAPPVLGSPPPIEPPTSTPERVLGVPIFVHRIDGACPAGYVTFESECAHSSAYRNRGDAAMLRSGFRFFVASGFSPRFIEGGAPVAELDGPSVRGDGTDAGPRAGRTAAQNLMSSNGGRAPLRLRNNAERRAQICQQYQSDFARIDYMQAHGTNEERQMAAFGAQNPMLSSLRAEIERGCAGY